MSAKLLKITFVILLLVTLGELGYYYFVLNNGEVNTKLVTSQPTPSQVGTTSASQRPKDALVSREILDFIGALKKNPNQKFHLRTETSGFVAGIDETTDKKAYIFKIVDDQGKKIMNYVWSKEKTNDLNFYLIEGDKKTPITINDLRTNDKIAVVDEHEVRDNIIDINVSVYR